ncbi:unnamed protein product [Polarella glacialis]|uniref:ABC transporter domain-containing protein n=2 Tax=Polarella glacialis TaxID=89957 RepID=A0A813HCN4_POLGL|nr:unnamed protein product [Polarella glacialis]
MSVGGMSGAPGAKGGPDAVSSSGASPELLGLRAATVWRSRKLLNGASWALQEGDRAALAGPSGCGKSLQLQLLLGEETASVGGPFFAFPPDGTGRIAVLRAGWLAAPALGGDQTVHQALEQAPCPQPRGSCRDEPLMVLDFVPPRELASQRAPQQQDLCKWLGRLGLEALAGDRLSSLSPSLRLRVALGTLLVWHLDALLLDEPEQGMPDDAVEWLEEFLSLKLGSAGAEGCGCRVLVVASRDRDLMDRVCNKVIDLAPDGTTTVREGGYTKYLSGSDFLRFHGFSLWQPKSGGSGLRATQATCAFASLVCRSVALSASVLLLLAALTARWVRAGGDPGSFRAWGVDVDEPSLAVARQNFQDSPWTEQLRAVSCDFTAWAPEDGKAVDVCVCNPPYSNEVLNRRSGSEDQQLSRRRALERDFMPLEDVFARAGRLGCEELWLLWGNSEDGPVLDSAAATGWRAAEAVRFLRSSSCSAPFATAWRLLPPLQASETASSGESTRGLDEGHVLQWSTLLWYDENGAPSRSWHDLVGSLYYWHIRRHRPEHLEKASHQSSAEVSADHGMPHAGAELSRGQHDSKQPPKSKLAPVQDAIHMQARVGELLLFVRSVPGDWEPAAASEQPTDEGERADEGPNACRDLRLYCKCRPSCRAVLTRSGPGALVRQTLSEDQQGVGQHPRAGIHDRRLFVDKLAERAPWYRRVDIAYSSVCMKLSMFLASLAVIGYLMLLGAAEPCAAWQALPGQFARMTAQMSKQCKDLRLNSPGGEVLGPVESLVFISSAYTCMEARRKWLDDVVIGMSYCPWAQPADEEGGIRVVESAGTTSKEVMADLVALASALANDTGDSAGSGSSGGSRAQTALLVCPNVEAWVKDFASFHAFYVWYLDCGFALAKDFGVKVVPFHPQYALTDSQGPKAGDSIRVPGPDGEVMLATIVSKHVGEDEAGEPCMAVRFEAGEEGLVRHAALMARSSGCPASGSPGDPNEDTCRHFASRAPRPVLHLLRIGDLEKVEEEGEPSDEVVERNEFKTMTMGAKKLDEMLKDCG